MTTKTAPTLPPVDSDAWYERSQRIVSYLREQVAKIDDATRDHHTRPQRLIRAPKGVYTLPYWEDCTEAEAQADAFKRAIESLVELGTLALEPEPLSDLWDHGQNYAAEVGAPECGYGCTAQLADATCPEHGVAQFLAGVPVFDIGGDPIQ